MKDDTAQMEVFLEAFLSDSIIVSLWNEEVNSEKTVLAFQEFKLLPMKEIEWIKYNRHNGIFGPWLVVLVGLELVIIPVLLPLISGDVELYSDPAIPIMIGSGIALYFWGRHLYRKAESRIYQLGTEWSYQIVKK